VRTLESLRTLRILPFSSLEYFPGAIVKSFLDRARFFRWCRKKSRKKAIMKRPIAPPTTPAMIALVLSRLVEGRRGAFAGTEEALLAAAPDCTLAAVTLDVVFEEVEGAAVERREIRVDDVCQDTLGEVLFLIKPN
jgi:hypothetical protein